MTPVTAAPTVLVTDDGWEVALISLDGRPTLRVKYLGYLAGSGYYTAVEQVAGVMGEEAFGRLHPEGTSS